MPSERKNTPHGIGGPDRQSGSFWVPFGLRIKGAAGPGVRSPGTTIKKETAYDVWFAQYASTPSMYYNYQIWQYSDSGSIPGISGKVDMDLAFIPY